MSRPSNAVPAPRAAVIAAMGRGPLRFSDLQAASGLDLEVFLEVVYSLRREGMVAFDVTVLNPEVSANFSVTTLLHNPGRLRAL